AMQEYNRCLEGLGLKSGSSLSEIKKRYRNLVKKVHPDLNQNLSSEDQERFVALTKLYDRIVELRAELKIGEQ
ncbi:MAG: J domain-containing protein, partial [Proteobacteria bacterium]|nr:J domain-containing protein [Pseudomonadota bacterium]